MTFLVDGEEELEVLDIFMEECAECIVEASKIIRFGNPEDDHGHIPLEKEIGDLLCMVTLLVEYGIIHEDDLEKYIEAKREKLKQWSNLTKL